MYRSQVYIVPTSSAAVDMAETIRRIAAFRLNLASRRPTGSAEDEGYIPRGLRYNEVVSEDVGSRTVDMLIGRLKGEAFKTEWPVPQYDRVPPAPPLKDLKRS